MKKLESILSEETRKMDKVEAARLIAVVKRNQQQDK